MPTQVVTENTTAQNATPTDNGGSPFAGVEDAWLRQAVSGQNNGSGTTLKISKFATGDHNHGLLRAALSNIPADQQIDSATLYLRVSSGSAGPITFDFRECLRTWGETTCTWTDYDTSTAWGTAGGLGAADRESTVSGAMSGVDDTADAWYSVSLTTLVAAQYAAAAALNVHIERNGAGEDGAETLFHSSEAADGSRPELVIAYSAAGGATDHVAPLPQRIWRTSGRYH